MNEDRLPFSLPIVPKQDSKDLSIYKSKITALIKSQAIKVVSGQPENFENEVAGIINFIWQDGYSEGLKDMDLMHKQVDAMIGNASKI